MRWHGPRLLVRSVAFYPVTACYVLAVVVLVAVVQGGMGLGTAAPTLAASCLLVLIVATWREVHTVHKLVNSQRDELIARIDQLLDVLERAGVPIPSEKETR